MYINTLNIFLIDVTDKRGLFTARAKARAQPVVRSAMKRFASGEEQAILAPVVEGRLLSSTLQESRVLCDLRSRKHSRLYLELASTLSPQKKRRPSFPYDHKAKTPV